MSENLDRMYWTSADGQSDIPCGPCSDDLDDCYHEARESLAILLDQCGSDAERAAILAGHFTVFAWRINASDPLIQAEEGGR